VEEDQPRTRLSTEPATLASVVAALVIVSATAFVAWAVYGSWFFGDDFEFLSDVARGEPDAGWIFQRHNVHFMPLSLLLVMLAAAAGPYVWAAAATPVVLAFLAASVACWWMSRTLFGHRLRALVPLVFFCFSPIAMPALAWWAAALNMVMCLPFLFTAITSHVLLLRTGHRRWAVAGVGSFVLGLGFYIKVMLLPVVLVLITLLYFTSGTWRARLVEFVRRWWWVWGTYAAVGIAYLVTYSLRGEQAAQTNGLEVSTIASLAESQALNNLPAALLGGPWRWTPIDLANGPRLVTDVPPGAAPVALTVLAAFTAYVGLRYRGALKATVILVVPMVATVALLALGRLASFGPPVELEVRYWADALPYLALVLGLMTMPLLGSSDPLRPRDPQVLSWRAPRPVVTGIVGLYVVSGVWYSAQYIAPWHDPFTARVYVQNAKHDLGDRRSDVPLANVSVPESVMPSVSFPLNLYDRVLAPIGGFRTPAWSNEMQVLDPDGLVVPGEASGDLTVPDRLLRSCWRGEDDTPARIPLGQTTFDYPFWASLTYRIDESGDARVTAGDLEHDVRLVQGRHVLTFRTSGSFDAVRVTLPARSTLCVDSLTIGQQVVPR